MARLRRGSQDEDMSFSSSYDIRKVGRLGFHALFLSDI